MINLNFGNKKYIVRAEYSNYGGWIIVTFSDY